jgi:hypothetical protein
MSKQTQTREIVDGLWYCIDREPETLVVRHETDSQATAEKLRFDQETDDLLSASDLRVELGYGSSDVRWEVEGPGK